MSFMLTAPQFLDGSKDVTRRIGWSNLKPGDRVRAVKKAMGLKKGEKVEVLGVIEIVSVRREFLNFIDLSDVAREGFPLMTPDAFVAMFQSHMKCKPFTTVNRIEFKRIDGKDALTA